MSKDKLITSVLEDWIDIRAEGSGFLNSLSRVEFIAYATAMALVQNNTSGLSAQEWHCKLSEAIIN